MEKEKKYYGYDNDIKSIIELSYKFGISHIPSALSQMQYFKYLIPKVKFFDWVAGKQFGWQAYSIYDSKIDPNKTKTLLLNGINKEFKYIEETLGNSLGVSIGLALTQTKPIWLNVSDSIFQMGRILEALPLLKKFNLDILITVDFNNTSRSKTNLYDKKYIKSLAEINNIKAINMNALNPNLDIIDSLIKFRGPRIIIFETIKGYGVEEFIKDPIEWHYKILDEITYNKIMGEK